jgi:hypothetical protein
MQWVNVQMYRDVECQILQIGPPLSFLLLAVCRAAQRLSFNPHCSHVQEGHHMLVPARSSNERFRFCSTSSTSRSKESVSNEHDSPAAVSAKGLRCSISSPSISSTSIRH